jgi:hypothetical protein
MGYHIILKLEAYIKPEYVDFINCCFDNNQIQKYDNDTYTKLLDEWNNLGFDNSFYEYNLDENNKFKLEMSIKPYNHSGDLETDYIEFVKKIIVLCSNKITTCSTEHDDFGYRITYYTDDELRETKYIKVMKKPDIYQSL